MEQARCERNKGRHGKVMNNLVGEQQDLNTWASKCVCVCGADEMMVALYADVVKTNEVTVLLKTAKLHPQHLKQPHYHKQPVSTESALLSCFSNLAQAANTRWQ